MIRSRAVLSETYIFDVGNIPINLDMHRRQTETSRTISRYSMSNYSSQEYSKINSSPGRYAGIKEYDHRCEIIVDLSRSIYREIHNLFNPARAPGTAREGAKREKERKRGEAGQRGRDSGAEKIRDCVARVKKIDRSANTRTRRAEPRHTAP